MEKILNCKKCGNKIDHTIVKAQNRSSLLEGREWVKTGYCSFNCYLKDFWILKKKEIIKDDIISESKKGSTEKSYNEDKIISKNEVEIVDVKVLKNKSETYMDDLGGDSTRFKNALLLFDNQLTGIADYVEESNVQFKAFIEAINIKSISYKKSALKVGVQFLRIFIIAVSYALGAGIVTWFKTDGEMEKVIPVVVVVIFIVVIIYFFMSASKMYDEPQSLISIESKNNTRFDFIINDSELETLINKFKTNDFITSEL